MDINGFLERYSGLSELTRKAYRNSLSLLENRIADSEPTNDEIRAFLRGFKKGTTIQRHKSAIKRYFIYKERPWLFDSKEFTRVSRSLPRYLDRDRVEQIINGAHDQHQRMFVKTLFMTGVRIFELLSLTAESIESDGIRITGKGNKQRIVPISEKEFLQELKEYAKKQKGKLFPDSYYNYWLLLRRLGMEVGVEIVSPHSLRHSRAVDLLNKGLSLGGVQSFLGHKDPATTLIYAQLTQRDLKRELERLEG